MKGAWGSGSREKKSRGRDGSDAPREKVSGRLTGGHPLARPSDWYTVVPSRGEAFALCRINPTGAIVSEELSTDTRSDDEKRGITIGILVVALLCLSLFFVWRHFGVPGSAYRPGSSAVR